MSGWQPEIDEVLGRLPYASNATLLARTTDDDLIVYKPSIGERPLWDFPTGTLAAREVLAFQVSAAAGFDVVPETVLVDGPFGAGSGQRFILEDQSFDPAPAINAGAAELWPFAVLDLVVNNADRKAGHILREQGSSRLWSIDHGVTFHEEPKLRTVLWIFSGCQIPDEIVAGLDELSDALPSMLDDEAARHLGESEREALRVRVDRLRAQPVHPEPPADRPAMPWPLY